MKGPDFIPYALDRAPPVFMGCTRDEIQLLLMISGGAGVLIGFVITVFTGAWPVFLGAPIISIGTTLTLGAKLLARAKRNRPLGYHVQVARLTLSRWIGTDPGFIHRDGCWDGVRHAS
ncbi:MAG: TIGR03750 family conjugal transfer protein [Gammaproteobacteria bacterium]|nr:TIGR03750 family conjugal transfer protein [Gammaproteobacteria bacterium]MCP5135393.1 TIGR03750 family conjugal transfer protein [Gammaproteobacteria bacterium]